MHGELKERARTGFSRCGPALLLCHGVARERAQALQGRWQRLFPYKQRTSREPLRRAYVSSSQKRPQASLNGRTQARGMATGSPLSSSTSCPFTPATCWRLKAKLEPH